MSQSITFERRDFAPDDVEVPDDPDDVFEQLLADGSRVCQGCFTRLRRQREYPAEAGERHGDVRAFVDFELPEGEPSWNIVDREWFETTPETDRVERMYPPSDTDSRTGCDRCGAVEPHRSPPTRSRSEVLQAAVGIASTLQEYAVAHNPLVLLVEVGDLKRKPEYAGDDFATFSEAVSRAIRAGRGPRRA